MSISNVRPYLRTNLETLGFVEHRDYLNFENIPGNLLDNSFHLETVSITGGAADQLVHTFEMSVNVRLFRRSYNDTVTKHEELIADIERVNTQVLNVTTRTTGDLFDLIPGTATIEPLGDTTDNWQVAVIPYLAVVKLCF